MIRRLLILALVGSTTTAARAQEHTHEGATPEKLGRVRFVTSCKPSVQPQFNRAVALLHSFEFGAAIKGFNDVLAGDSTCAMAYWGLAMSRWSNPMAAGNRAPPQLNEGRNYATAARRLDANTTARERGYIDAVSKLYDNFETLNQAHRVEAYSDAMGDLVARQPADTEAKIFHAISLVAAASPADKTYASQKQAGAILEALWKKQPDHPGLAHYIIHTYDYPSLAPEAVNAAEQYATIAPSAAHALHMPSHIFTRTGKWGESIDTNLRSIDVAKKNGAISEALHAADYAEYAYLQLRQYEKAKAILDSLPALASRFDPSAVTGAAPPSAAIFAIAAIPARYALERSEWTEAVSLSPHTTPFAWTDAMTYFARALGAAHTGNVAVARTSIDSLESIRVRLAASDEPYWSEQVAIQEIGARAWLKLAEGDPDSALTLMQSAASREDATEKNAVTPGPLAPARELLADMLSERGKHREALAEYENTLKKEPNRYRSLAGALREAVKVGDKNKAASFRRQIDTLH